MNSNPHARPAAASTTAIVAALLLVQVLFATHYVAAKIVVGVVPPRVWAAMRVSGAALLLLALTAARRQALPRGGAIIWRFAGFALLGVAINQVCFVEGLARTTTVNSVLINCTIPVLTLAMAVLAGHERPAAASLAGLVLALGGIAVLLRLEAFDPAATLVRGNLLTVVNAASYSAFLVVSKRTLEGVPTLPASCLLFLLGTPPLVALALPELRGFDPGAATAGTWALGAYIIVFPTVVAYLLNTWALRRAPSSTVALFIYVQPPLAALMSRFWLGEVPGRRDALAFLLVAAGIAVVVRGSARRRAGRA
jgi:drug/metabolite transporter (DMT)-like permease